MDIFNLNEKVEGLVSYLQETGYSAMYIGYVKKMAEWLSENANHYKWQSFSDVEPILKELWSNKYTYRNKVRLLRVICQYIENGLLPDGCKHYSKPHHYELLGAEYKDVTDMAFNMVDRRCKFSINVKYALSSFFFRLQEMGVYSFESITENAVLEVFSKDGKPKMGHSFKYSVEYGLKACLPHYGKSVERIIAYLPSIPNMRKNIQYLTEQELTAIRHTLEHDSTISLQDKAIITLAMYTGLRGCDISALTLDSFDWEHDLIKITQAKTGQPLTLPLRAVVGNAVFDYLLKERPRSPEPYVFLTVQVPYRRLHTSNLDAICSKVMCKAGIRQGENERKSLHLFRHNVATALLQGGVQQPVISATLEHDSTISLQDKAIITLAMYTGLRGCDISALTLDSFDWEHDLIKITQAKTGQPLTLPLRAVVGNAVFDYLLKERPRSPEPYVFLTVQVPYRRLHTSNLDAICSKVMCKAGIRQGENERKSLHLFRHNVATALLQGGVQQPVISATLGHASPDSLDRYLSAEFKRLKECSLSIEYFPVGKGVFDV